MNRIAWEDSTCRRGTSTAGDTYEVWSGRYGWVFSVNGEVPATLTEAGRTRPLHARQTRRDAVGDANIHACWIDQQQPREER